MSSKYRDDPPLVVETEHFQTPASEGCKECGSQDGDDDSENTSEDSRGKVSCGVDGVATVETKADPDGKDGETNKQWDELLADLEYSSVLETLSKIVFG